MSDRWGIRTTTPMMPRASEDFPPVRHLLPLGEHLAGPHLDWQVQPAAEVPDHALLLQQQRHTVDRRHVVDADHLEGQVQVSAARGYQLTTSNSSSIRASDQPETHLQTQLQTHACAPCWKSSLPVEVQSETFYRSIRYCWLNDNSYLP